MRVLLIRHPKPVIEPGICYGQLDLAADQEDLERVVGLLGQRHPPIACASSPLIRAHHLAQAMEKAHGWPSATTHHDLKEMSFGQWENRDWKQIERSQVDAWAANMIGYAAPGGESVTQLAMRSASAIRVLVANVKANHGDRAIHPDSYMAIFCHAGVLIAAPTVLRGEPLDNSQDFRLKYGYGETLEIFVGD
jgi:alpha-ribazole phosphatase